jgi:hypothetical protein
VPGDEGVTHLLEELWRQEPVVTSICIGSSAQIVARPDELISLADENPGWLVIQMKIALNAERNLYGRFLLDRRLVRDRKHNDRRRVVALPCDRKQDHAWSILSTLFLTGAMLVMPKIGVGDHQARLGNR